MTAEQCVRKILTAALELALASDPQKGDVAAAVQNMPSSDLEECCAIVEAYTMLRHPGGLSRSEIGAARRICLNGIVVKDTMECGRVCTTPFGSTLRFAFQAETPEEEGADLSRGAVNNLNADEDDECDPEGH